MNTLSKGSVAFLLRYLSPPLQFFSAADHFFEPFFFLDDSPRLGNDKETIKGDGVCDSGIGEEVTTQKFVFGISDVFVLSFLLLLFVPSTFFLRKFLGFLVYNFCLFLSFAR